MKSRFFLRITPGLLAGLLVLIVVIAGCKPKSSRPPLSADEVKTIAAVFEKVSSAHIQAWNSHDINLIGQLYTDDITYYETGNFPDANGTHEVSNIINMVLQGNPNYEGRQIDTFIGHEDGFDICEIWNWSESTKENPYHAYDWFTLRDSKIAAWWLFWDSETSVALKKSIDQKPLQDYATAWSSGDKETVASLYDPKVFRQDSLYGENQQGNSAIKEFATNFFAWYPGVRLELQQSFKQCCALPPKIGGEYAIHVSDQAGKPCDVRAIILLEVPHDKITKEWVFYNADSLIACGWAK